MGKDINNTGQYRELILRLIRQSAKDRASSQRWSIDALILIGVFLVIILLLDFQGQNSWLVTTIAIAGLVILWVYGWFRSKNLESKFYDQELHKYEDILNNNTRIDSVAVQPSESLMTPLTQKELDILSQMADGKMNKEIARALDISESTVKNYVSRIFRKLEVNTRTAAVMLAMSRGWIKKDTNIR